MRCRFHHASSVGLAVFWFALGTSVNASPRFASATLVAETVVNGQVDSGEGVAMSLCIRNPDATPTAHLTGTLSATSASGPQSYGSLAPNETACRTYTFVVGTTCGSDTTVSLSLSSSAGGASLPIFFLIEVGAKGLVETFDTVVAPAVPAGWAATLAAGPPTVPAWATVPNSSITPSNQIFAPGSNVVTDNRLTSPSFLLPAGASTVSFTHFFDFEQGFDGGVLEIAIGQGAFADIVAAGGSLPVGGYTGTVSPNFENPLAGRNAWTATGSGQTVANMPAAAAGQSVRLRWRLGTDGSVPSTGWNVENIVVVGTSGAAVPTTVPWSLQGVANGNLVTFSWRQPASVVPTGYLLEASVDAGLRIPVLLPYRLAHKFHRRGARYPRGGARARDSPGSDHERSEQYDCGRDWVNRPARAHHQPVIVGGRLCDDAGVESPIHRGDDVERIVGGGQRPRTLGSRDLATGSGSDRFHCGGGLPAGTYFIHMRAAGPVLAGQPSNEVTVTVPGVCTPPATPILFQVVKSAGTVTISWELPPLGTSAPSQFVLEAGTTPGTSNLAVVPLTGKTVTATPPPGNYHVRVFARNSCGDSAKTADVSFAIP